MKLSKKGIEKLYNSYNTMNLLYAVDSLDQVRYILADDDETLRPPEIRQRLEQAGLSPAITTSDF